MIHWARHGHSLSHRNSGALERWSGSDSVHIRQIDLCMLRTRLPRSIRASLLAGGVSRHLQRTPNQPRSVTTAAAVAQQLGSSRNSGGAPLPRDLTQLQRGLDGWMHLAKMDVNIPRITQVGTSTHTSRTIAMTTASCPKLSRRAWLEQSADTAHAPLVIRPSRCWCAPRL